MSKKEQFSEREINDLFSKMEIPFEKDKDLIWSEKFESLVEQKASLPVKKAFVFRMYWQYGIAASLTLLLATTLYLSSQNPSKLVAEGQASLKDTAQDLLADQTMIESLFVEENEFDEWFEEQYVLSSLN
jgi:hypothetical protein